MTDEPVYSDISMQKFNCPPEGRVTCCATYDWLCQHSDGSETAGRKSLLVQTVDCVDCECAQYSACSAAFGGGYVDYQQALSAFQSTGLCSAPGDVVMDFGGTFGNSWQSDCSWVQMVCC